MRLTNILSPKVSASAVSFFNLAFQSQLPELLHGTWVQKLLQTLQIVPVDVAFTQLRAQDGTFQSVEAGFPLQNLRYLQKGKLLRGVMNCCLKMPVLASLLQGCMISTTFTSGRVHSALQERLEDTVLRINLQLGESELGSQEKSLPDGESRQLRQKDVPSS